MVKSVHTTRLGVASVRRGVASVLAMTYLVLFSVLAVGFFAATTMSVQVSKNDISAALAQKAAESGLQFVRWHLDNVDVRANYDFTADPVFLAMYSQMAAGFGTPPAYAISVGISADNKTMYIPAQSNTGATQWLSLDGQLDASNNPNGAAFTATLTHVGDKFLLKVTGRNHSTTVMRAIQLNFQKLTNSSAIFNFGLVSKGKIVTSGSSWVEGASGHSDPLGSVLSVDTAPGDVPYVTINGRGVSGDISVASSLAGSVTYSNASVGGTTDPTVIGTDHVHTQVIPPPFPDVDTTSYMAFATNALPAGSLSGKTFSNTYIPPNTNPTFSGNTTINGVLLIYPPNNVRFLGNVFITGVIVAPSTPGGNNPAFDASHNTLTFGGNVTASDVSNLNPAIYGSVLPTMTGGFLLAPSFAASFTGNFGTVNGSIIAGNVSFSGAAHGTIEGSIINTEDTILSVGGTADVIIAGRGTTNVPTGVSFGDHLAPLPGTYDEVMP